MSQQSHCQRTGLATVFTMLPSMSRGLTMVRSGGPGDGVDLKMEVVYLAMAKFLTQSGPNCQWLRLSVNYCGTMWWFAVFLPDWLPIWLLLRTSPS